MNVIFVVFALKGQVNYRVMSQQSTKETIQIKLKTIILPRVVHVNKQVLYQTTRSEVMSVVTILSNSRLSPKD